MSDIDTIQDRYDVVVVGGGPAGTTCAHLLSKRGWSVLMVEKARHPRFQIGESLLPWSTRVWDELGLMDELEASPYPRKYGAWFDFHEGYEPEKFVFGGPSPQRGDWAFNVERPWFDELLWDKALAAGAQGVQETQADFLVHGEGAQASVSGVELTLPDGYRKPVQARLTVDAAGRGALLGAKLGIRRPDPKLNMMAMYAHYVGATRFEGQESGVISIIAIADGWAWAIPFHDGRISVGMVVKNTEFLRRVKGRTPAQVFTDYVAETPAISGRLGDDAELSSEVWTTGNFSYRCDAAAGSGWALVGDAAAFVDPVFSSGVHLAMEGARRLVEDADRALKEPGDGLVPARALGRYTAATASALKVFSRFIYDWYDDGFRLAFLRPPPRSAFVQLVKRNLLRILAGDVYRPWRALPWLWTLELMAKFNVLGVKQLNGGQLPAPGCAPALVPGREARPPLEAPR